MAADIAASDDADEVADPFWSTVCGVELPGALDQRVQLKLQRSQLAYRAADLDGSRAEQLEYMTARQFTFVAERDDAANLTEAEPNRLRRADEGKPIEYVGIEVPIARRRPDRSVEEANVLVIPDRLRRHARSPGDLANKHRLTFQCAGSHRVVPVDIDILTVPDCPHAQGAKVRLMEALNAAGTPAHIRERIVASTEEAEALGMRGSPTFLFDGLDPFPSSDDMGSMSCRLYALDTSLDGIPSVDQFVAALRS